ncbi:tetratricopeptide repeat protein [Posidoniimonas polymericola]|uniref:tetratricopeptide repeat protein n=1 Tax=Posidoniimonas polymericola TaxID=2528002 RepID=UPI0011B79514|nr:tetratricopeptide repeat protein [Posidoniimonas polymericola]
MALRHLLLLCLCVPATPPLLAESAAPPAEPLSERQRDQIDAAASYALATTLFASSDLPAALHAFERAWRWDPGEDQLLDRIVPLAVSLGRADEAIRYALIRAGDGSVSPEMLRRLALFASESEQWDEAKRLYELWLQSTPESSNAFERAMVRIELGRLYRRQGNAAEASACLAKIQKKLLAAPNSKASRQIITGLGGSLSQVYEMFGKCHLEAGELHLAAEAFSQARDELETDAAANYWLALLELERSQPLDAYAHLQQYFAAPGDPLGAAPYELLRKVLVKINDREHWPAELSRLREQHPDSLYGLQAEAETLAAAGKADDAAPLLRRLIDDALSEAAPIDEDSFAACGVWLLRHYAATGEANRVIPLVSQLGKVHPSLDPYANVIKAAISDNAFAAQVNARLRLVADQPQTNPAELLPAAYLALTAGEIDLATSIAERSLADDKNVEGDDLLSFAVGLLLADQGEAGAGLIRRALEQGAVDEESPAAWYYLSAGLRGVDDTEAVNAARRAAELAPASPEFAANVARVLQAAGQTQAAADEFAAVLRRFESDPDPSTRATLRETRLSYSYLLLQDDRVDDAVEQLQQVLDEFPSDPGASNDLSYLWSDRGLHLQRALRLAETAVAAEPDNPAYLDSRGWGLFKLGRFDEARDNLAAAVNATDEADPEILNHLAYSHLALGDRGAALRDWRRALSLIDDAQQGLLRAEIEQRLQDLARQAGVGEAPEKNPH